MRSFAFLFCFVTAALAQSSASSAAAATPSANPLIPTGISSGCSTYLNQLNSDSSLSSCTAPLIAASKAFGPGSTDTPSTSTVSAALDTICSSSGSTCSDQTIRSALTKFYSACSAELTSNPNNDVIRTYDVLYAMTPLKEAMCTKDDSNKYCVEQTTSSAASGAKVNVAVSGTSTPDVSSIKQYLWSQASVAKRAAAQTAAIVPNTTTYHDSNLLFLFLSPSMSSSALCTTCTRNILTQYINFETSVPYGPGLSNSPLMSGQSELYNAVLSTCGKTFFSGAVQAAGGISNGVLGNSNAAPRSLDQGLSGIVAAVISVAVASTFMF